MFLIFYVASAALGYSRFASGIPLEHVVYSELDQLGESIRFTKTHSNTSCGFNLIGGMKSWCRTGQWFHVWEGGTISWFGEISEPSCHNGTEGIVSRLEGLYRLGPADSSTPAIVFLGKELQFTIVEKIAEAYLDYTYMNYYRVCTYGTSEWTLFSEPNFEGNSTCLKHSYEMDCTSSASITQSIGSVIRGCDLSKATIATMKSLFTK